MCRNVINSPPMKKLTSGLKRHKRVLTMLSAAIVFISFTLKKELGEHLRDRLAVIDSVDTQIGKNAEMSQRGRDEFIVRQEFSQVIAFLRKINKTPDESWRESIMVKPLLTLHLIDEEMNDVSLLASVSPREEYYKAGVNRLVHERSGPYWKIHMMSLDAKLTPEAQKKIEKCEKQLSEIVEESSKLHIEALGDFLTRKSRLERAASVTKWSVYILFIFGWTLGLALSAIGVGGTSATVPKVHKRMPWGVLGGCFWRVRTNFPRLPSKARIGRAKSPESVILLD